METDHFQINHLETKEKEPYIPPPEIQLMMKNGVMGNIIRRVAPGPLASKAVGALTLRRRQGVSEFVASLPPKDQLVAENLLRENPDLSREFLFGYNYPRTHWAGGKKAPVLPSDGMLTRSSIQAHTSEVLGTVEIDLLNMLGLGDQVPPCPQPKSQWHYPSFQEQIYMRMKAKMENYNGGLHDLAILRSFHKHCCTVPLNGKVELMYRVDSEGRIFPHDLPRFRLPAEKLYPTDPEFVARSKWNIYETNQRMVFVIKPDKYNFEYIMVAHGDIFARGIQPLVGEGQKAKTTRPLFRFIEGSSVSVIWPQVFRNRFAPRSDVIQISTGNNVLGVLQGQQIYHPK